MKAEFNSQRFIEQELPLKVILRKKAHLEQFASKLETLKRKFFSTVQKSIKIFLNLRLEVKLMSIQYTVVLE